MSLATLFSPINDRRSLEEFAFANQTSHLLLNKRLYELFNLVIPNYSIFPIPDDVDNWAAAHQQAHNDLARILGISNFDFSDVDFDDEEAMAFFVQSHGIVHREAEDLLRIGIDF